MAIRVRVRHMRGFRTRLALSVVALSLACFLAVPPSATGDPPSAQVMTRVSQSVVQVLAHGCGADSDRAATGFVWTNAETVVTVLHLVGGCERVSVYFEGPKLLRQAVVVKTLARADLALLRVEDPPTVPALPLSLGRPDVNEDLAALGYRLSVPKMASTRLSVPYGSKRLDEILPENVRREIGAAGSPKLDLEILLLEGHLLPGLSGAPIFDREGRVVAVGDGGLENGAAAISWGLPVAHVRDLARSNERMVAGLARTASQFAADLSSSEGEAVRCGDLTLTKVRTRPFEALVESSDDPASLVQLTTLSGLVGIDMSARSYDVYQHLESGATVAVPEGLELRTTEAGCIGEVQRPGRATITILGRTVRSQTDVEAKVDEFHRLAYSAGNLQWQVDPNFSYPGAHGRFDGLQVRRQSFIGYTFATGIPQQQAISFETLMARGSVFVGVTTITYEGAHLTFDKTFACGQSPQIPYCQQVIGHVNDFVSMLIGTFLATFPIG